MTHCFCVSSNLVFVGSVPFLSLVCELLHADNKKVKHLIPR